MIRHLPCGRRIAGCVKLSNISDITFHSLFVPEKRFISIVGFITKPVTACCICILFVMLKKMLRPRQWVLEALVLLVFACSVLGQAADPSLMMQINAGRENGSLSNLAVVAVDVEALWPKDPGVYFLTADGLATALEGFARTNPAAGQVFVTAGQAVLSKSRPEDVLAQLPCCVMKARWMTRFAQASYVKPDINIAFLMAKSLHETESAVVTNFQMNRNPRHLILPPITPTNPPQNIVFPGTLPRDIEDPVAREAWIKALDEDERKARLIEAENYFQDQLPMYTLEMKRAFYRYCHELFLQQPGAKEHRYELGKAAGLTPPETGQLGMDF